MEKKPMPRSFGGVVLLILMGLFLVLGDATAQSRATLSGSIQTDGLYCPAYLLTPCTDRPSEPIRGALITVRDSRGKQVAAKRSDRDGNFSFRLRQGRYVLAAPKFRFKDRIKVGPSGTALPPILVRP